MRDFTLAVGQWPVVNDKAQNLESAESFLRAAAQKGATLCVLPEMFLTPYELPLLRSSSEELDGPTLKRLRSVVRELKLYVVAGTFCEKRTNDYYNSAYVLDPEGEILGVHRKIHLFDVALESVNVKESAVLTPGDHPLVLETPFCRLGVCVCYDTRFPDIFRYFESQGVEVVAIPAAFSQATGSAHWHVLMRSRAVDYQVYLAAACPAPNLQSSYVAYGHSLVVDPWGTVLAEAGEGEDEILAVLRAEKLEKVRRELPLIQHRRPDLYRRWVAQR